MVVEGFVVFCFFSVLGLFDVYGVFMFFEIVFFLREGRSQGEDYPVYYVQNELRFGILLIK